MLGGEANPLAPKTKTLNSCVKPEPQEVNKVDPFTSMVQVKINAQKIVALVDTGSGGNSNGLNMISAELGNQWRKNQCVEGRYNQPHKWQLQLEEKHWIYWV